MADVASSFKNWSSSAASNFPTSSTTIGAGLAPNLQQIQATVRTELGTRSASVTASATTDLGVKDEGTVLVSHLSGTLAITSFGTVSAGIKKLVTFSVSAGTLTITYNASSMILPSLADITVEDGDSLEAESLGSGNWKVHFYEKSSGQALVSNEVTTITNDPTLAKNDGDPVSSDWVNAAIGGIRFGRTTFSSPYTPAVGETLQRPHGLTGTKPYSSRLIFECVVADAGWSVGDRIVISGQWSGSSPVPLYSAADSTNCLIKCANSNYIFITNRTNGSAVTPTANSWKYAFEFTY